MTVIQRHSAVLIAEEDAERLKPAPDLLLLALRRLHSLPQEVVYVGDNPNDVIAARCWYARRRRRLVAACARIAAGASSRCLHRYARRPARAAAIRLHTSLTVYLKPPPRRTVPERLIAKLYIRYIIGRLTCKCLVAPLTLPHQSLLGQILNTVLRIEA